MQPTSPRSGPFADSSLEEDDAASFEVVVASQPADAALLVPLYEAYRDFYGYAPSLATSPYVYARLHDRRSRFFHAVRAEEMTGFIQLVPAIDTLALGDAWVLEDLFVVGAHRRNGIGRALLLRAIAFATGAGATRLTLSTAHTNHAAQRLYERHRFVHDTEFRTYTLALASRDAEA